MPFVSFSAAFSCGVLTSIRYAPSSIAVCASAHEISRLSGSWEHDVRRIDDNTIASIVCVNSFMRVFVSE